MTAASRSALRSVSAQLERRLRKSVKGAVHFDAFARGRYATDASIYQVMPAGVVIADTIDDAVAALQIAGEEDVPVTFRGGGTSQCGQTINDGLIIDFSTRVNKLFSLDVAARRCVVEPGIVLDDLNAMLKPHDLWFPVDVSTSSRATIGGMAGNNSCGARSIRYGTMRDNVVSIDAVLVDGRKLKFGDISRANEVDPLFADMLAIGAREADEIALRVPKLNRRVGGYNLDALVPGEGTSNLAHLLVGSEGTLALSQRIKLKLSPIPKNKAMGLCHFPTFRAAMESAREIVKLEPVAVELIDDTMVDLARSIPIFRPVVERLVRGAPKALLMVEFAEEAQDENLRRLKSLHDTMGDLGHSWPRGGVVDLTEAVDQAAINEMRKSGLNIMMSMKSAGKPVSFVEDCAVPLQHLADYTERLTAIFRKHGTEGTWYAHASVGCLHVRPVLNLRLDQDVKKMRAIAEEAFDMVRAYKGSHSGEHGDGIVRSEFHEFMFGKQLVASFGEVKNRFDPKGLLNPGRIVDPPRMDDRTLLRFHPRYGESNYKPALDWSGFSGGASGFQGAAEMCNNNGACRKLQLAAGSMCPSYRVTRDEQHVTRGRANTLRLALSGQLGPDALAGTAMADTLKLCVSCKACRRECPTGVDMARMKIEVGAARAAQLGLGLRERLVAYLPRYAPYAARIPALFNVRDAVSPLARLSERIAGLSARRRLPRWRRDIFSDGEAVSAPDVLLLADTFNRYFERETLDAARRVLQAAGRTVGVAQPAEGGRPLCCGRTFLAAGLVDEARREARRLIDAVLPHVRNGAVLVGLEPSCLFTLRDEYAALGLGGAVEEIAAAALLFEEFLAREGRNGRLKLEMKSIDRPVYLHGHCHQKAFGVMNDVERTLSLIPRLEVETIPSSCCGMAGAFGYQAETYDISMAMGELSLLPAVRDAPADALIVADGISCRHQIADGAGRKTLHVAQILDMALAV